MVKAETAEATAEDKTKCFVVKILPVSYLK